MKLTGDLKNKVDAVNSKEEKKAIIAQAGLELSDDELEGVAGGALTLANMMEIACPKCGKMNKVDANRSSFVCNNCGYSYKLYG